MNISAKSVIEELMDAFDDIENYNKKYPKKMGLFHIDLAPKNDPRLIAYRNCEKAESQLNKTCYILGITWRALYSAILTTRRWYKKTNWQKCLPDDVAERLMACMTKQYPIRH